MSFAATCNRRAGEGCQVESPSVAQITQMGHLWNSSLRGVLDDKTFVSGKKTHLDKLMEGQSVMG